VGPPLYPLRAPDFARFAPLQEEDWESRLRSKPTAATMLATLASGGVDADLERWGGQHPSKRIAAADRI